MRGSKAWPKVGVIVLNWNKPQDTIRCLQSLRFDDYPERDIVIVDNASTDDSAEKLQEQCDANLGEFFVRSGSNLGYAGGNNLGIRFALQRGADFILVLNNDTFETNRSLIRELVSVMNERPNVGIVGPRVLDSEGRVQQTILYTPSLVNSLRNSLHVRFGKTDPTLYLSQRPVEAVSGVCLMVRRQVFEQVGMFNESYFMYVEEQEFCYRARLRGWTVLYTPIDSIVHTRESTGVTKLQYINTRKNTVRFIRTYQGRINAAAAAGLFISSSALKYLSSFVRGSQYCGFDRRWFRLLWSELMSVVADGENHA